LYLHIVIMEVGLTLLLRAFFRDEGIYNNNNNSFIFRTRDPYHRRFMCFKSKSNKKIIFQNPVQVGKPNLVQIQIPIACINK